ncbi:MAG: hypothetical protein ACRD8O_05425, partial [Bryobacteraceae bacterium]
LKTALTANLAAIDRTILGFEDFSPAGARGITAGRPAESLLYHALASPRVTRDANGAVLRGFPTAPEIETVENFVFGVAPRTLASIVSGSGVPKLSVVVFATEYRCAADTATGAHADLVFSRTGIARVGTARPKYLPEVRGCWPEDENNPHGFRVVPVRFTVWLAAPVKGNKARVMRLRPPSATENARTFWRPIHKLFDGPECISGLNLTLTPKAKFFNLKLQKVRRSVSNAAPPTGFPFVITEGLANLQEHSGFGRLAVVPVVQQALVERAMLNGQPLTYSVPAGKASGFATYTTEAPTRDDFEIHRFPAYVHARTKVENGNLIDLNDETDVNQAVDDGGYEALLYVDFTGEGWLEVAVAQLAGKPGVTAGARAAYVLLSAPDFFPSTGQRETSRWSTSSEIPQSFRNRQIWGIPPEPLSEIRLAANLQLPNSPFDSKEDTMTAVTGMDTAATAPLILKFPDIQRAATLPDDGAGVFAPGWDAAVDVKGAINTGTMHLAGYGLGSPFPEDAKLCAALSTFWPAVAPDVYRTMSPHSGNSSLRGSVAPLTDEEIGQIGSLPWDGIPGPRIVQVGGQSFVEMASFLHADYVVNALENRFSIRLTSRITAEEYQRRVLAAARVHWVLSGGVNVRPTRTKWLLLSFRSVPSGEPELQQAQQQAGRILNGPVYRVEACFVGTVDPTVDSPKGPRFRLLPVQQHSFFFVAPQDTRALRRRATDPQWGSAAAE